MPSLNKNTTLQRLYCVTGLFLLFFIFFELLENTQNSTFPKILLALHTLDEFSEIQMFITSA